MTAAGRIKQEPATSSPFHPATRWPMWIAISVEFGPGIRFAAPSRSRNSACVIQPRRRTISSSIRAMCAAAEPEIAATVADDKASVEFHAGKQLVTRYHIGPAVAKPYFYPVLAPGGVPVTRDWPMKTGAPQETKDHVHQKSAWFCHGDVIPEGLTVAPSGHKTVKAADY